MKVKRSPLAPRAFPKLPALAGVRLAAAACTSASEAVISAKACSTALTASSVCVR